jgi:hypothetical protein
MEIIINMNKFILKQFCLTCRQNVYITFKHDDGSGVIRGNCKCGRPFFYVKL